MPIRSILLWGGNLPFHLTSSMHKFREITSKKILMHFVFDMWGKNSEKFQPYLCSSFDLIFSKSQQFQSHCSYKILKCISTKGLIYRGNLVFRDIDHICITC